MLMRDCSPGLLDSFGPSRCDVVVVGGGGVTPFLMDDVLPYGLNGGVVE